MLKQPLSIEPIDNSGNETPSNHSNNQYFSEVLADYQQQRRGFLRGGLSFAVAAFMSGGLVGGLAGCTRARVSGQISPSTARPGFAPVSAGRLDNVRVPTGYSAIPFVPWGTPINGTAPAFKSDATNSAAEQSLQVGSHHDGMHFFPIDSPSEGSSSKEGLLVMNHEYVDPNILHFKGPTLGAMRPADEVSKEMEAHGVSVLHIAEDDLGQWNLVPNSMFSRRITGTSVMDIRGPARGSSKLATRFSPDGEQTRGTLNNCAHGVTPWNTYLTAEENWAGYFVNRDQTLPREQSRYGVSTGDSRYRWETADAADDLYKRFNAAAQGASASDDFRNEPNHFGWLVEIDPFDSRSVPQKRTALGRFAHEGVIFAPAVEGQPVVCYSGDDSRNEYIYKFVSAAAYHKVSAGGHLLDSGTLYVARFLADGSGEWLPLDIANSEFMAKAKSAGVHFADQADVLINARLAADVAGATKMDRPEWGAVRPQTGEVYFTLTNNADRMLENVDAANPRARNPFGHILRWQEQGVAHGGVSFTWDIFLFGGPIGTQTEAEPGITLDETNHFASPDGLWFDRRGLLWILTDMSGGQLADGPFGHNQMLVADPETRELRRFLVGPVDCEVTGVISTPDLKTLFVNIQHPGEQSLPGQFTSHWPHGNGARPRSATIVIRKDDGGVIGS